jgi:hypothetical protein
MRLFVVLTLAACGTSEPPPTATPAVADASPQATEAAHPSGLNLDDPTTCAPCHAQVVAEWKTAMHARAHHDEDPVYAGMRSLRMKKQGDQVAGKCAQCHNPRAPEAPDSPAGRAGVSCATCHHLAAVDTSGTVKGAKALTFAEGDVLRGPHTIPAERAAGAPHGLGPEAPWLTDGQSVCLACHGAMKNPQGVPTCTTGPEHAQAEGAPGCTTCHMPEVAGSSGAVSPRDTHRSHAFHGPHDLWRGETDFMATAVDLSATLDGTTLTATLVNQASHGMPSAFPGRVVLVHATGTDASGQQVWTNFEGDPMKEDREAVLNKVYVDAEGKPTLPPFSARLASDTRLRPDETRTLSWTVPDTVVSATVALKYRLVPPKAVGPLGLEGLPEAETRLVESVTTP